jgi:hypothetical protein
VTSPSGSPLRKPSRAPSRTPSQAPTSTKSPHVDDTTGLVAGASAGSNTLPLTVIGAVAGVLAVVALAGSAYFFLVVAPRRRRRAAAERAARERLGAELATRELPETQEFELDGTLNPNFGLDVVASDALASAQRAAVRPKFMDRALKLLGVDAVTATKRALGPKVERQLLVNQIMSTPVLFELLLEAEPRAFPSECVLLWKAIDRFERYQNLRNTDMANWGAMAHQIVTEYVRDGARSQVPLSAPVRQRLEGLQRASKVTLAYNPDSFAEAKAETTVVLMVSYLAYFRKQSDDAGADAQMKQVIATLKADDNDGLLDEDPKVSTLMGLGFSRSEAVEALEAAGGNVEEAAQMLIIGGYAQV